MPNDATPPDTPEKPSVPGLRLLKLVGKGASGEVWTCRNETDTSFSAVKIVRRGTRPEKVWYRHELKALRKYARIRRKPDSLLDIKHVAVSEDKTFLYYTTPVADGIKGLDTSSPNYLPLTLKSLLADGNPILPASAAEIAARIAEALQTLHEHGLLHRDVKPDNIIFCEGRAVLADIGLVTETEQDVSLAGTPRYMEPGQTPSVRTDLYALGKVLYEMVNGKDPECFPDCASLQDSGDIGIFRLLNDICMRACGEESERYGKASQMLADLRRAASPDRPQEEAPNKLEPLSGSKRRASIRIAAGLCLLAVVLCHTYISSLWPKTYGALLEFASTLKGVCYVAFVVLAALQARKRVARTMAVVLTALCITAYLNGKIAQYFQEQEMERYTAELERNRAAQEDVPRWEDRLCDDITIRCPAGSQIEKYHDLRLYLVSHPQYPTFAVQIKTQAQAPSNVSTNSIEVGRQCVMNSIDSNGFKLIAPGFTSVSHLTESSFETTWQQCNSVMTNGVSRFDIVALVEDILVLGCYLRDPSAPDESHKLVDWVAATCSGLTKK